MPSLKGKSLFWGLTLASNETRISTKRVHHNVKISGIRIWMKGVRGRYIRLIPLVAGTSQEGVSLDWMSQNCPPAPSLPLSAAPLKQGSKDTGILPCETKTKHTQFADLRLYAFLSLDAFKKKKCVIWSAQERAALTPYKGQPRYSLARQEAGSPYQPLILRWKILNRSYLKFNGSPFVKPAYLRAHHKGTSAQELCKTFQACWW